MQAVLNREWVVIENWRAFRRRYFSVRGITEGTVLIYHDDSYRFLRLHTVSVIKGLETSIVFKVVLFIKVLLLVFFNDKKLTKFFILFK